MYENIEREFKKVSAYYTYKRIDLIGGLIVSAYMFFIIGLAACVDTMTDFGFLSETTWKISVAIVGICFLFIIAFLERFKPKEKEYYAWLKFFKFEKKKNFQIDKTKLKDVLVKNNILTAEQLREVVEFYRSKKKVVFVDGGGFLTVLALCFTAIAFIFSVNDGYTDMRLALAIIAVAFPLVLYYIYKLVKRKTNVYSNFYQIIEQLLSEILVEDLVNKIKKPRTKKSSKTANAKSKKLEEVLEKFIENKSATVEKVG